MFSIAKALNYEIRVVAGNANLKLAKEIAANLKVRLTETGRSYLQCLGIRVSVIFNTHAPNAIFYNVIASPRDYRCEKIF